VDGPTVWWRTKTLGYPAGELDLAGPGWLWGNRLLPLYSLIGLGVAAAGRLAVRGRFEPGRTLFLSGPSLQ
jgi:hypothetical protein